MQPAAQQQLVRALEDVQVALSDCWGATWHRANAVLTLAEALADLRAKRPQGTPSRQRVVVCFTLRSDVLQLRVRWSDLSLGRVLDARPSWAEANPSKGQQRFSTVAREVFHVRGDTLTREQSMFKFAIAVGSELINDGCDDLVGEYGAPPRAAFPHKMSDLCGATGAQFAAAYREAAGAGARVVPSWTRDVRHRLMRIVSADRAGTVASRGTRKRRAPAEPEEDEVHA